MSENGKEILNEGKTSNAIAVNDPQKTIPVTSSMNSLKLYLSYNKVYTHLFQGTLELKKPNFIYDHSSVTPLLSGSLHNGGLISSKPEEIEVTFACERYKESSSTVELILSFSNHDIIKLYFSKQCEATEAAGDYFSIVYTIYWILILLVFFLFVAVVYNYMNRHGLDYTDILQRLVSWFKGIVERVR